MRSSSGVKLVRPCLTEREDPTGRGDSVILPAGKNSLSTRRPSLTHASNHLKEREPGGASGLKWSAMRTSACCSSLTISPPLLRMVSKYVARNGVLAATQKDRCLNRPPCTEWSCVRLEYTVSATAISPVLCNGDFAGPAKGVKPNRGGWSEQDATPAETVGG